MSEGRTVKLEFSTRHLIIIIGFVALAAVILPVSVQAATGSAVNITDPTKSTYKAKVSGVGALLTGICSWNNISTPTCATVSNHALNVTGPVTVNGGFVYAGTDVTPFDPVSCQNVLTVGIAAAHDAINGGRAGCTNQDLSPGLLVAITSLTAANNGTTDLQVSLRAAGATDCSDTLDDGPTAIVPAGQTVHLDFPQPYVAPGGGKVVPVGTWYLCAISETLAGATPGAGSSVIVSVVGFMD